MHISCARKVTAAIAIVTLLPVLCSCTLFGKKAVTEAASLFGEALTTGDTRDILNKTDGLEKDFKQSFKDLLNVENYTEEETIYADHMMRSIAFEVDDSSVKIKKDRASCDMEFTVADHEALQKADYRDIDELAAAIDSGKTRTIEVTAEFVKIEKQWYVSNFDDAEFTDLYSFLGSMPVIGRQTLLDTASQIGLSVVNDDVSLAVNNAASARTSGMTDLPSYLADLYDVNGNPTEEEKVFREAVLANMTYEVVESSLQIEGQEGSVEIDFSMPAYETLAGKTFKKLSDITGAVNSCEKKTYYFKLKLVRNGAVWYATNLDDAAFAGILNYKKFSISLKKIDGTYQSTLDVTDKFVAYVAKEFSIRMPSDLEGRIMINATLVLKDGKYSVTIDNDAFVAAIKAFVETNIDKIIMNMLGTTSTVGLDALSKIAGYADYADMRQKTLDQVNSSLSTINTSGLESSGTFTVDDNTVTLTSGTDVSYGTIDNFGAISVTSPVKDADARNLLGSDTITLKFEKA